MSSTGNLLEAKADIDFMYDGSNVLHGWVNPVKDPAIQMRTQAKTALAAGRLVVWHAQTMNGYLALEKIANGLGFGNLSVVFDPNGGP